MSMVTLTGWGQPHDALRDIAPNALHLDYAACDTEERVFDLLAREAKNTDAVIGWSMGGQFAVRAAAAGIIAPRHLVLIATPYQFVASAARKAGMDNLTYTQFRDNYARDAARTLAKSYALIAHRDRNAASVRTKLDEARANLPAYDWLRWFEMLGAYSCDALDLSRLPPTLLLHGSEDAVVGHRQSEIFAEALPTARLIALEGCGHAPHWHDTPKVMKHITEFLA